MSIRDMDVTPRRDPAYIRSREFARVRKGYDPDQVRDFLHQLAGWFDDLETDLASARAEHLVRPAPEVVERPVDPSGDSYSALGERVAEVLRAADQHAQRVRAEAEETAQRVLDEARRESVRLRERAQQEAEAVHQSTQEQAEAIRRSAQDEADRVTQEAARALEAARLEAERLVAGLAERRNLLSAELHATRTRLMGIVSRLEEDTGEGDPFAGRVGGAVPADDPRRDPLLPDIPDFTPPTPPRVTPAGAGGATGDAVDDEIVDDEAALDAHGAAGVEAPGAVRAPATGEAATGLAGAAETTLRGGAEPSPPGATEASLTRGTEEGEVPATNEAGQAAEDVGTTDPAPAAGSPRVAASWMWTREEQADESEPEPPLDLSFPDFGPIDIPSLEDDEPT